MTLPIENDHVAQRGRAILGMFGSFWLSLHGNRDLFRAYGRGLGELLAQRLNDLQYAVASLSRHTMPVYKPTAWKRFSFLESQVQNSQAGALAYGDSVYYGVSAGNVTISLYGGRGPGISQQLDVSPAFRHASTLSDLPFSPSCVWVYGTDFWVDETRNSLCFRQNPFAAPGMPVVDVYNASGQVVDREISLWGFNCYTDMQDMSNRFGVVLGLTSASSSPAYNALINAAIDCLVDGPSLQAFRDLIYSMAGARPVQTDGEIVQDVHVSDREKVVITDRHAYRFGPLANILVQPGDHVDRDTPLSDAVRILTTPQQLSTLPGLSLDRRWASGLQTPLSFPNELRDVRLSRSGGADFPVVDLPGDAREVKRFWLTADEKDHAALVAALSLPSGTLAPQVNPLHLLLSEMRGSLLVVRLRPAAFPAGAPGVSLNSVLRRLLPARVLVSIIVESETFDDVYEADSGVADSVDSFETSGSPLLDQVPLADNLGESDSGIMDAGLSAWIVDNPCQG